MAQRDELEAGLMQALTNLLGVSVGFGTRFEREDPQRIQQALVAAARNYAATVAALRRTGGPYGWQLYRALDNMATRVVVDAEPKTSDALD